MSSIEVAGYGTIPVLRIRPAGLPGPRPLVFFMHGYTGRKDEGRVAGFAPRPLLMINGDRDVDQPYLYSLELYRKLKPLYRDSPEKLSLHMPPRGTSSVRQKSMSSWTGSSGTCPAPRATSGS